MADWAASGRKDTYTFAAVDPFTLVEICEVQAIPESCSLTFGYYTDNKAQANISIPESEYPKVRGNLIRVSHTVELPTGETESEVLGTFFIDSADKETDTAIPTRRLVCYSTMWRLSKSKLTADYVYHTNQACLEGLTNLMTAAGSTVVAGQGVDNSRVHTRDGRFAIGKNRLECANTYAGWLGWIIGVDGYGRQTLDKYVIPANRAPKAHFENGANCVYLPKARETSTGETYNEVIAYWSREKDPGDGYGLCGRAYVQLDAANPYSYQSCGVRMTGEVVLREPTAQADLQTIAQDYLNEHDAAIRYIEIEHVGIPNLHAGDTITYTNSDGGDFNLLCEITQMQISKLGPLCMTKTKLKVVGE